MSAPVAEEGPVLGIDVADMRALRAGGASVLAVDVRTRGEFDRDHVDAALHVAGPDLLARLSDLRAADLVVCVCDGGTRSIGAARLLRHHGLPRTRYLVGGVPAWRAETTDFGRREP